MRLAVTGANGFVGRHVVARAAEVGWDVIGIVRSDAAADVVSGAGGRPVVLASPSLDALSHALEGSRGVVHLAQIGAERKGQTYEAVNVELTARVVEACRQAEVPRVVYFSGLGVAQYGMKRRCTNPYFLSKLAAETLLFRSDRECVTFRPSFVVGPGDALVRTALAAMAGGAVEVAADGSYRLQPVAVTDAAALVLAAITRARGAFPIVFDLVGPEAVSYTHLLERLARIARQEGRPTRHRVREIAVAEAERRAREGGYQGMHPDELDCLLCDEVADSSPLVSLLGHPLTSLDAALGSAVRAA